MQRTNILRDIDEDAANGRVYIARETLERFGGDAGPGAREALLRDQIAPADALYDEGWPASASCAAGRRAIAAAARDVPRDPAPDRARGLRRPRRARGGPPSRKLRGRARRCGVAHADAAARRRIAAGRRRASARRRRRRAGGRRRRRVRLAGRAPAAIVAALASRRPPRSLARVATALAQRAAQLPLARGGAPVARRRWPRRRRVRGRARRRRHRQAVRATTRYSAQLGPRVARRAAAGRRGVGADGAAGLGRSQRLLSPAAARRRVPLAAGALTAWDVFLDPRMARERLLDLARRRALRGRPGARTSPGWLRDGRSACSRSGRRARRATRRDRATTARWRSTPGRGSARRSPTPRFWERPRVAVAGGARDGRVRGPGAAAAGAAPMKVVVVGAGVGGLAAAVAPRRAPGTRSTVLRAGGAPGREVRRASSPRRLHAGTPARRC